MLSRELRKEERPTPGGMQWLGGSIPPSLETTKQKAAPPGCAGKSVAVSKNEIGSREIRAGTRTKGMTTDTI